MAKSKKETPLMTQYNSIKAKYPDALLLFRVGDFYETFGLDAIKASKILGIVLTKRNNGDSHTELAGFPHHSIETYLPKLVRAGLRVAICDQLEDPKMVKGIVKRGVTELITPGVTFNEQVLSSSKNNFLLSVHCVKEQYGIALIDISTGEFLLSEGDEKHLLHICSSFDPSEIIYQRTKELPAGLKNKNTFKLEDWAYQYSYAQEKLTTHFKTQSLKGFGIEDSPLGIVAAGAIMAYLIEDTHHNLLSHISSIRKIDKEHYVTMDAFTVSNLELVRSTNPEGKSLLDVINHTITPMGARLLRRRILLPTVNLDEIESRLDRVSFFIDHSDLRFQVRELLKGISDVDRLLARVSSEKISPKELGMLRESTRLMADIDRTVSKYVSIPSLFGPFHSTGELLDRLYASLNEDLPVHLSKGKVIRAGVHPELDRLRTLQSEGQNYLNEMCQREIAETGIASLKIDYNNVFGYYIEVRNTHRDKVPGSWIRKQTLVNAERYITEELKEYENQILGAESKIAQLETSLFRELCAYVLKFTSSLQLNADWISKVDVAASSSELAVLNDYTRPEVNKEYAIDLKQARHPIIEKSLPLGEKYIPNDLFLDRDTQQILMVTGPNMGGKSAVLRQTALVCLLAQTGNYVPAQHARIGMVDKIFTRVGASDNISAGESTFMVEMNEAASILNNISERSLILLDEVGRGTSTYDGVSIAWAIAEYLHNHKTRPKTLFATHYHELNEMSQKLKRIHNFHVTITESGDQIIFLRKLAPGGSAHSFGIHVAKLAGMPASVLRRASEILQSLEKNRQTGLELKSSEVSESMQLSFFQLNDPVLENIKEELDRLDINQLTPLEALSKLNFIKNMVGK